MTNITTPLIQGNLSVASQVCELMLFRPFSRSVGSGLGRGCYARSSLPSSVSKTASSANFLTALQLPSLAGPPFPPVSGLGAGGGLSADGLRLCSRGRRAGRRAEEVEAGTTPGGSWRWARWERSGTRLAPLAASAGISVPQPCASPALVSGSAASSTAEAEAASCEPPVGLSGSAVSSATFCAAKKGSDGWVAVAGGCPSNRFPVPAPVAAPPLPPCLVSGAGRSEPSRCWWTPAGRATGSSGLSAPGLDEPVPGHRSRGLGYSELGGALAGCGEPAFPGHRGGARDALSVQRVWESVRGLAPRVRAACTRRGAAGTRKPAAPLPGCGGTEVGEPGSVDAHARGSAAVPAARGSGPGGPVEK